MSSRNGAVVFFAVSRRRPGRSLAARRRRRGQPRDCAALGCGVEFGANVATPLRGVRDELDRHDRSGWERTVLPARRLRGRGGAGYEGAAPRWPRATWHDAGRGRGLRVGAGLRSQELAGPHQEGSIIVSATISSVPVCEEGLVNADRLRTNAPGLTTFSGFDKRPLGNKVLLRESAAHFYARAALLNVSLGSLYGTAKGDFGSGTTICSKNDEGER